MRILEMLVWLLPPVRPKNWLLRRFGHEIAGSARIGPNIVAGVGRFHLGEHASIGPFNVFKSNSLIFLDDEAGISSFNWISAASAYQLLDPGAGSLIMAHGARIEGRNYLDCSGTIEIGAYSAVGGQRCLLQTHEPNLRNMTQTVGRIVIGHHSLVGSCSVLLKGATLPSQSVLAAHSTMTGRAIPDPKPGVYGGTPAKFLAATSGDWFERSINPITDLKIDGVMGPAPAPLPTARTDTSA